MTKTIVSKIMKKIAKAENLFGLLFAGDVLLLDGALGIFGKTFLAILFLINIYLMGFLLTINIPIPNIIDNKKDRPMAI